MDVPPTDLSFNADPHSGPNCAGKSLFRFVANLKKIICPVTELAADLVTVSGIVACRPRTGGMRGGSTWDRIKVFEAIKWDLGRHPCPHDKSHQKSRIAG
jgi:hypothetical protein